MKLQLIRHATMVIDMNGQKLLTDPMLCKKGKMDPVEKLNDFRRNPTVELPVDEDFVNRLLESIDAVLITHTHRDHFDSTAAQLIPRSKPLICQPEDEAKLKEMGFGKVIPVHDSVFWNGIEIVKTSGHHGRGKSEKLLGVVSGFVLKAKEEPVLYIAGDTILCKEVEDSIEKHKPDILVVNAGAASLLTGAPITMTAGDVEKLCSKFDDTKVVAVHMEAFNHCSLTRKKLKSHMEKHVPGSDILIPEDGKILEFPG